MWKLSSLMACRAWASGYRPKQSDEQATYTGFPPSVERRREQACARRPFPRAGRVEYRLATSVQGKTAEIRLAQAAGPGYSPVARRPARPPPCPNSPRPPSSSTRSTASVRDALAALDRHEAALPNRPPAAGGLAHARALGRLEENLTGWQAILGDMAERVRAAQDDLAALDADLRRSLDAFATARKHLQGA